MTRFIVTSFCNFPHRLEDGKPIRHECYVIAPAFLAQEARDGTWPDDVRRTYWAERRKVHKGWKPYGVRRALGFTIGAAGCTVQAQLVWDNDLDAAFDGVSRAPAGAKRLVEFLNHIDELEAALETPEETYVSAAGRVFTVGALEWGAKPRFANDPCWSMNRPVRCVEQEVGRLFWGAKWRPHAEWSGTFLHPRGSDVGPFATLHEVVGAWMKGADRIFDNP